MFSIWWKVKENGNDIMLSNSYILWDASNFRWEKVSLRIMLQEMGEGLRFAIISNYPLKSFQENPKEHLGQDSLYHQSL